MTGAEARSASVVRRYFDGCNSGDLDVLLGTLTPDVGHYFLDRKFPTNRGAEHLTKYWRKYKTVLDPIWSIDRIVAQDHEVVSEWSRIWTPKQVQRRILTRRSEWYVMRDARIAEVLAYFTADDAATTELVGFPYGERSFLAV